MMPFQEGIRNPLVMLFTSGMALALGSELSSFTAARAIVADAIVRNKAISV
jgi:hypothetical protein